MLRHIQTHHKGGVMARRDNPKCYDKKNQKKGLTAKNQSYRNMPFSQKPLSLENTYTLIGISVNRINLLKIGTSGDISSSGENSYLFKTIL